MDETYAEAVMEVVDLIPAGMVASYGDVAVIVGHRLHRGGPRLVGQVMARQGSAVPWWRVVRADGRPATCHEDRALELLRSDDTPLTGDRVDLRRARWQPDPAAVWREILLPPRGVHSATEDVQG